MKCEEIKREIQYKMSKSWKPQQLQMGAVIQGDGAITNLDFHKDGKYLVMTTNESAIHVIDSLTGQEKKKLYAKNNGIGKVKYTHHDQCIIMSSERKNYDLKYLCLYDNRYIRYYQGHTDIINSISMSPTDDCFITAGSDNRVNLWNLSTTSPIATLQLPINCEKPYASYDSSGVIFGVLSQDTHTQIHSLKLFDARSFDRGPFENIAPSPQAIENVLLKLQTSLNLNTLQIQRILQSSWNSFEFSPDGSKILVNTLSDLLLSFDSFNTENEPTVILSRKNEVGTQLGVCFSADGQYIVGGNDDNELQVYSLNNGEIVSTLSGHVAPVGCVKCNPRYDVMAAGCVNTALWIQSGKDNIEQ